MQTKQMKRDTAEELAAARAKLSPARQIRERDSRLGEGQGAKRERSRLAELINAS